MLDTLTAPKYSRWFGRNRYLVVVEYLTARGWYIVQWEVGDVLSAPIDG